MPIESILKCNKIKTLTTDKAVLIEAVLASDKLELNTEKTEVTRKGGKAVPELEKTGKRKQEEDEKEEHDYIKDKDLEDPY